MMQNVLHIAVINWHKNIQKMIVFSLNHSLNWICLRQEREYYKKLLVCCFLTIPPPPPPTPKKNDLCYWKIIFGIYLAYFTTKIRFCFRMALLFVIKIYLLWMIKQNKKMKASYIDVCLQLYFLYFSMKMVLQESLKYINTMWLNKISKRI